MEETLPESLSSSHSHMWHPEGAGIGLAGLLIHETKVDLKVWLPAAIVERVEDWEKARGEKCYNNLPTNYTYTNHFPNQSLTCKKRIRKVVQYLIEQLRGITEMICVKALYNISPKAV